MRGGTFARLGGVVVVALAATAARAGLTDRVDYWRSNYEVLTPAQDPRVADAKVIFGRLLRVAGNRRGVLPRLLVVRDDKLRVVALPDGWIVLSSGAIDLCYADAERGDDRLAFVLAHEIAHQLKDDFWHMRFFQAVRRVEQRGAADPGELAQVREIAGRTDEVLTKELQADEQGVVYAAMAGFDTRIIVGESTQVNFFKEWVSALDPGRLAATDASHPTPAQRAQTVRTRLASIAERVTLFELGVLFYQAGQFDRAVAAFRKFLTEFPSREVYQNLAASHHQLALQVFRDWQGTESPIAFAISVRADPQTRGALVRPRGGPPPDPEAAFKEHMDRAIELYEIAIRQDPAYVPAYTGLAAALLARERPFEAIAVLRRAKDQVGETPQLLNALGVAFHFAGDDARAERLIGRAWRDGGYPGALFNLGQLATTRGQASEAKDYWGQYLEAEPTGAWAGRARAELEPQRAGPAPAARGRSGERESLAGVEVGYYVDELPADWGTPETVTLEIAEWPHHVLRFPNGIRVVIYEDRVILIAAPGNGELTTAGDVGAGDSSARLLQAYGPPAQTLEIGRGTVWQYPGRGIAFLLRDDKLDSWILFETET